MKAGLKDFFFTQRIGVFFNFNSRTWLTEKLLEASSPVREDKEAQAMQEHLCKHHDDDDAA